MAKDDKIPNDWDRSGLPGWTYHSQELFDLELQDIFLRHWLIAGHVNDIPEPGDFITHDVGAERAVVVRGHDGVIRAFHNLCRHRGARVVGEERGRCNKAMICPYHGWAYNLDGTLRGVAERDSFPPLDRAEWGLKPVEMEIWHGLIFLRFLASDQPPVAQILSRYEHIVANARLDDMVPAGGGGWAEEMPVNWKAIRDVDNEGYHVRTAHPGLHDLYGDGYHDEPFVDGAALSVGRFNEAPSKLWSVRSYRAALGEAAWTHEDLRSAWFYVATFPSAVIGVYPDSVMYYQEIPVSAGLTKQEGAVYRNRDEDRSMRLARYLSSRIDRDTLDEDQMLTIWAAEATQSSAYDGVMLSDLEYGLKTFHDHIRDVLPVAGLDEEPEAGNVSVLNAALRRGG